MFILNFILKKNNAFVYNGSAPVMFNDNMS